MRDILLIVAVCFVGLWLGGRSQVWESPVVIGRCASLPMLTVERGPAQPADQDMCSFKVDRVHRVLASGDYVIRQGTQEVFVPSEQHVSIVLPPGKNSYTIVTWIVGIATVVLMPAIALRRLLSSLTHRRGISASPGDAGAP